MNQGKTHSPTVPVTRVVDISAVVAAAIQNNVGIGKVIVIAM